MGFNSFTNCAMVGTGIFTITGTAAAALAGPALVVSIVISMICVSFMLQAHSVLISPWPSKETKNP